MALVSETCSPPKTEPLKTQSAWKDGLPKQYIYLTAFLLKSYNNHSGEGKRRDIYRALRCFYSDSVHCFVIPVLCLVYLVHNTETVNESEILRYEKEYEKIIIEIAGDKRSPQS